MEFEGLIIDRPLDITFQNSNNEIIAFLDDVSNLSLNTSSETKDKTSANGELLKRFYTAKSLEISAESAVLSFNLLGQQFGDGVEVASEDNKVEMPRILQVAKGTTIELPADMIEGTLSVYGCSANGIPDINKKYTQDTAAGEGKYAITDNTLTLPTDASDLIQIMYMYNASQGVKVTNYSDKFPSTCAMTIRVLACEKCDKETMRIAYIYVPSFQMAPDFEWSVDTESNHAFSGTAQVDACSASKKLCYVSLSPDDMQ